jgi:hypothetical protein
LAKESKFLQRHTWIESVIGAVERQVEIAELEREADSFFRAKFLDPFQCLGTELVGH